MATSPHGKLLLVSSPYTMSGALWDIWQRRDVDPDTPVWRAPTALMNPTVSPRFLAREQARDPDNFRREYLAEFTDAVSSFLTGDTVNACVVVGRTSLPPDAERNHYVAAVDAAYKGDRFTMCIAHRDHDRDVVVIDRLEGWQGTRQAPLRLDSDLMPQIKALAEAYGIYEIHGDQFGAEPLKAVFTHHSLTYAERTFTNTSKADIYATLRTLLTDGRIELLDHEVSLRELRGLELELLPGGALRIGHPGHGKARDDFADVIALAVSEARSFLPAACGSSEGEWESLKLGRDYGERGDWMTHDW
jgi:hypothetical protein